MTGPKTDQELLRCFAERGSESAFTTLVERHVDLVFATALRRLGDAGAAQEVSQDVFVALARKALWLLREVSLVGWLHKTTLLQSRQWWRGELRRQRREQTALQLGTTMKDDHSKSNELSVVLDEGLMELREGDRQALMLHYFEGCNHRAVGALLGVGEDAARKRTDKALNQLAAFFRRRGYAVPALATAAEVLQASARAAPVELATVAAQAALSAGGTASATALSVVLARFMGLTKVQTAVACLVLAAAPITYQWHRLASARAEHRQRTSQLTGLRQVVNSREQAVGVLQRRLRYTDESLARLQHTQNVATRGAENILAGSDWYRWDEASDYVRLPKSLLPHLTFGGFELQGRRRARSERVQLPPVAGDGTPSPALLDALGLTDDQARQVGDATRQTFADFEALMDKHSYLTNQSYSTAGTVRDVTLVMPAFPREGAPLEEQFSNSLVQVMGPERTAVYWQQAQAVFRDSLNGFGAAPRQVRAYVMQDGQSHSVEVEEDYYQPDGTLRATDVASARQATVPGPLKPYVDAMENTAQVEKGGQQP